MDNFHIITKDQVATSIDKYWVCQMMIF